MDIKELKLTAPAIDRFLMHFGKRYLNLRPLTAKSFDALTELLHTLSELKPMNEDNGVKKLCW